MKKLIATVILLIAANIFIWSAPPDFALYDLSDPGPPKTKPPVYMPISCPPLPCIAVTDVPLVVKR